MNATLRLALCAFVAACALTLAGCQCCHPSRIVDNAPAPAPVAAPATAS